MSSLFGNLCRTCLGTPNNLYSFQMKCLMSPQTEASSRQLIRDVLLAVANSKVQLLMTPELPEQLCEGCLKELMRAKAFLDKCEQSEMALKSMLDASKKAREVKNHFKYRISHGTDSNMKEDVIIVQLEDKSNDGELIIASDDDELTWTAVKAASAIGAPKLLNNLGVMGNGEPTTTGENIETASDDGHLGLSMSFDDVLEDEDSQPIVDHEEDSLEKSLPGKERDSQGRGINCPDCGIIFIHNKSLERHRLNYHAANSILGQKDAVSGDLPERFKCDDCEVTFAHKKTLAIHKKRGKCQRNVSKHTCCVCKREFVRCSSLINHLKMHETHEQAQKLVCSACPAAASRVEDFPDVPALIAHMQQHTASARHSCTECGRSFNMYSSLKDHIRTHSGQKPFLCPICGKGFSQSTNLKQHLNRHEQKKNFKCTPPCSASFVSKGELETHMRKHTGEHPFACECGQKFTTSSSLVRSFRG